MELFCSGPAKLLLTYCAFLCLMQAHAGCEDLPDNDAEAWARREYFYVGGQYVQTTLVGFPSFGGLT